MNYDLFEYCYLTFRVINTYRWPRIYIHIQDSNVTWLERVILRLNVAKEVQKTLKDCSSLCYPVGQPAINLIDKLILWEFPIPEFVEDELLELIFHQET